ncbi:MULTISPECIES: toll/interleukin-1 receptor domain-containing protein [unclassified Mesorhizobium]|uniref:toll/interleukin-1 receptor domain-containing protein n=1 Tax=unclassified Mesorhizobium TaxID=325217 RepID=UPI001CCEF020|nr:MULTISPECIES: toll/interleukin-1 receptor domain-containing protein [unclassified Mesorhizobium]MBZ9680938.1 TIR domain-containing protein [Mesorhizobium sp. CO1-1-2]MBZ9927035.1 TIR domain-containing protein [Mesorhizobium sp. BR1-1-4]MBZ9976563.1 TIR domain-containing protein [Mesorhizobium sp. BR-1-1-10]
MKLPTVFLSLHGSDERMVEQVHNLLPDGLAYFYPVSFKNGENLVSAMEERTAESSMFVFFVSKKSLKSCWVDFEIDRTKIAKIKKPQTRFLVIFLDRDLNHRDLPSWMQEYWVGSIGTGARDIARYIRRALISGPLAELPGSQVYGRGGLIDQARADIARIIVATENTPNITIFAGNGGIGRRTFARKFLVETYPASPTLSFGPELPLPQFADLVDIYRALRQELENGVSHAELEKDVTGFAAAPIADQAEEVAVKLSHFGSLGQAVTLITGNGIYEDRGYLKAWAPVLFRRLEQESTKLVVVTNRLVHDNEARNHPNLYQLQVPPISDTDTKTLMVGSATALGAKPDLPSAEVIRSIGGHPGIAKSTAALIARKGVAVIDNDPSDLFALQEDVLSESLNFENLDDLQKDTLSVLSWVPQLQGDLLKEILLLRHNIAGKAFAETLSELILACLVEVTGSNYAISSPVRALFRRLHGYGSKDLMTAFSSTLKRTWESAKTREEISLELVDALAYMAAIEGGTLPTEFRSIILPSTLQEIIRDTYDRNHDNPEALRQVVSWGLPAMHMGMDETTREEILSYVVRAQTRLSDAVGAEKLLNFLDSKGYRARFYLRAFYLRIHKADTRGAIPLLLEARKVRKYMHRVVGELASCFQHLGMWTELHRLVQEEARHIGRNPVLLNVRIGMLIAQGSFQEAEKEIRTLSSLPWQEATVDLRNATIMMRRDQDYAGAQALLTQRLQQGAGSSPLIVRRLRAIAAAGANDVHTARADSDFLQAHDKRFKPHNIEARIMLNQRDFDGALRELSKAGTATVQDELLRARILEAKSLNPSTLFTSREELRQEALQIRARYRMLDEFELDG